MSVGRFLGMIGALIWRPSDGRYLVLRRSAEKDYAAGIWECITGRVDQGEGFTVALRREVKEELGVEIQVDFIVGTMHFFRGEPVPENEMIGIVYCCSTWVDQEIKIGWEHDELRWVSLQEAQEMFPEGYWLLEVIQRGEQIRTFMSAELISLNRKRGFEI